MYECRKQRWQLLPSNTACKEGKGLPPATSQHTEPTASVGPFRDDRTGPVLSLRRESKYWVFFLFFFFLNMKYRCYLFKRKEWQAISLANFLCASPHVVLSYWGICYTTTAHKRDHEVAQILPSACGEISTSTQCTSFWCDHSDLVSYRDFGTLQFWTDRKIFLMLCHDDDLPTTSMGLLSLSEQPAPQPSSNGLHWLEGEAGASPVTLMPLRTAFLYWLPEAGWGPSETQVFLWAFRSFDSPARPSSPLSSAMVKHQCYWGCVCSSPWYYTISCLLAHSMHPKGSLLPWASKLLSPAVAFVLGENPVLQLAGMEGPS